MGRLLDGAARSFRGGAEEVPGEAGEVGPEAQRLEGIEPGFESAGGDKRQVRAGAAHLADGRWCRDAPVPERLAEARLERVPLVEGTVVLDGGEAGAPKAADVDGLHARLLELVGGQARHAGPRLLGQHG